MQQRKNSFSEFTGGLKNLLRSWKYEQMCFDSRCLKEVIFLPFLPQRLKSFKENHTQKLMVKYHLLDLKALPDYYDKGFLIQMTYDVFLTEEAFCGFISLLFHFKLKMNFYQLSTWTSVEKIISALLLCHVSVSSTVNFRGHFIYYKTPIIIIIINVVVWKWINKRGRRSLSRNLWLTEQRRRVGRFCPTLNRADASELILILTVLCTHVWKASSPPRGLGPSSLFNSLHISDTPPGLRSCEKGRHQWCFHPESDPAEAGKGLYKKRTHRMEIPHLSWLACLHWPCRALRPLWHLFKIHRQHEV